jgi:hypothetical protein
VVQNNFHNLRVLAQIVKVGFGIGPRSDSFSSNFKKVGSDTPKEFDFWIGFLVE